jgi:hypothetical protein
MINIHTGMSGRFKLVRRKADTLEIVGETKWFDNLILNQGLERWATGNIIGFAKVGTSNTPPAYTQTALLGYVATSSLGGLTSSGTRATPPYYGFVIYTYRFDAGVAAGTLSEVGVGWDIGNADDTLWSRALILDANDDPTTITVLADEVLDVLYELRLYPHLVDKISTKIISGESYDCVLRASEIFNTNSWARPDWGWNINTVFGVVYNGTLGPITTGPNGLAAGNSSHTVNAYVPGSLQRVVTSFFELNNGNLPGGVTAFLGVTSAGEYKVSFSPAIPKDNTKTMNLSMSFSWGRYTP